MTVISNTEITSYNTCTRQHYYMYNHGIEPRMYPLHIRRGEVGHAILEKYYTLRMQNFTHYEAVHEANKILLGYLGTAEPDDYQYVEMLADLSKLMAAYFDHYSLDTFKVLAVEEVIVAPMTSKIHFGLILDLMIEIITGPYRGDVEIWDHKFVNNFKSDDDLKLNGQQPKYIKTAQLNGIPIKRAVFNQIRYRKMKDPKATDLFRRSPLISTQQAIETVWEEATDTAVEIYNNSRTLKRTLSYSACKNCFFKDICMAELAGEPVETMRKTNYKPRSRPLKDWMLSNV